MKFWVLIAVLGVLLSCAPENPSEQVSGSFIYYDGTAVLKVDNSIYGVVLDENANRLINQASGYKNSPEDFVEVILKIEKRPKPIKEEGWDTLVKVKEILAVSYSQEVEMPRLNLELEK